MIAYFVHNSETDTDTVYLPERQRCYTVNSTRAMEFIAAEPDFTSWTKGIEIPPEDFGGVIAFRDNKGGMIVLNEELWQQRLAAHLGELSADFEPIQKADGYDGEESLSSDSSDFRKSATK